MNQKPLEILSKTQTAVQSLGYDCVLLQASSVLPMDMLNIALDEQTKASEQLLNVSVFPLADELDGSHFIQFYAQYPGQVAPQNFPQLYELLAKVNIKLPLGHFNLSTESNTVYFKYVLVLADDAQINPSSLNDLLDMCIFAINNHGDEFAELGLNDQ